MTTRPLELGAVLRIDGHGDPRPLRFPADHLVTHGVVVGMTGSGKTGLLIDLVEETLRSNVPVLMIDVKGDLPDLLLTLPAQDAAAYAPWTASPADAARVAHDRAAQLGAWGLGDRDVAALRARAAVRVLTPGSTAGEPVRLLSALDAPSALWATDVEAARASLSATISTVMRLVGRDPDPTRSRDHVVLAHLAEARLRAGRSADLAALLQDLAEAPPLVLGALPFDQFMPARDRAHLATALNTLLASPTFAAWRAGAPLDPGAWLAPRDDGRVPAVIVSVAHLGDDERALVLGLLFEHLLAWVRTLPGTSTLRALVVFDEVFGFMPPHPANPPAKRPLIALMKQARAFGVGLVVATQNPMDLDYRALSNAGVWWLGRLETDADRARVVEGLAGTGAGTEREALARTLKVLAPRWFVMRDVYAEPSTVLLNTRATMAWMRGPLTRAELRGVTAGESTAEALPDADRVATVAS